MSSHEPPLPAPVPVAVANVLVEFHSPGRLLPWIGPALRGIVCRRFRERHCRLPLADQLGRWRHCRGCPHMVDCAYGRTFEPDEQVHAASTAECARGDSSRDVPRTVVIAPAFPAPVRATRGMRLPVEVVLVGANAIACGDEITMVLSEAGREGVLGTDRIGFSVIPPEGDPMRLSIDVAGLPGAKSGPGGRVSRLRLELTSPLFLRDRDSAGRPQPCRAPTFHRLARAAVDTLAALAFANGRPVAFNTRDVVAMARDVRTVEQEWRMFDQEKHSNRTRMRFDVRGVTGEAVFADVPRALIPWLALAGQLHVGGHRVAGAGGWRIDVRA